ncbi:MAG: VOC family protein [Gammaproteobacteria bacterium]|nr:VOC family protein [Gammaproteobacteria bacterium]NNC57025.1 VOC family protein [Woeseiaceae bacterium]NNL50710.1 VOC family protein [Woeseiaceae bacterium]
MAELCPFHLAIPVTDLVAAEAFYCGLLGCGKGRTASRWTDLDFFGHQLTLHLVDDDGRNSATNPVDGDAVPSRHFGVVLNMGDWRALADRLEDAGCEFLISPRIRFAGEVGEQATLFLYDPSSNALEFKSFADPTQLFAT